MFGAIERDPRERVVSVAYYALVNLRDHKVQAATDARDRDAQFRGAHRGPTGPVDGRCKPPPYRLGDPHVAGRAVTWRGRPQFGAPLG